MLKRIFSCVREYKAAAIATPLLVSMEVVLECLLPYIIAKLVNSFDDNLSYAVIGKYGLMLIIMAIGSLTFGILAGVTCAKASCGLGKNMRHDLFHAINDYSFENIDKFSPSSLVTRLTTDVTNVQTAFMMVIRMAIRAPFMLIFAFFMAFKLGGKLAIIFVFVVPFLGLSMLAISKKVMPIFRRIFKRYDKLNESVEENVRGIRVVKAFVRESHEIFKFDGASEQVRADFTKAERILALVGPIMQLCLYIVMIFTMGMGSFLVITNKGIGYDVGQMSAMLTYSFMILMSLMMVNMLMVMMTMASESASRIAEALDEKSTITSPENPVMEMKDGSIDFYNVSFAYASNKDNSVLSDIDLHIKSGETIGIIGATGSSKSTLVQLIPRLYDATKGQVKVGGVDVKDYDLKTLRDGVSMVLQKNVLFSGTITDNLRWGNENATEEEIREACKMACADEFILANPDGYNKVIDQGGTNVSGGQRQRLCIARALLKKPKIIIFDDSTSAVDTRTDALIRKSMREYIPSTTKIIIAQRTSSIEDADRIVVLDAGKISAIGTHEELLKNHEIYREIYISQNKSDKQAEGEEGDVNG